MESSSEFNPAELEINDELRRLHRPLSDDERKQLEANIREDGVLDPVILWNRTVLDGMNRVEICTQLGIGFPIVRLALKDFEEAKRWVIRHQLGRRNLSPDEASELRGRLAVALVQSGMSESKAAAQVASETSVSPRTVARDIKYAKAVQSLPEDLKKTLDKRKARVTRRDIVQLGRLDDRQLRGVSETLKDRPGSEVRDVLKRYREKQSEGTLPAAFNDATIDDALRRLVVLFDERARYYNCLNGAEHRQCLTQLTAVNASWGRWKSKGNSDGNSRQRA